MWRAGGPPKAIALPVCPECRAPIRRSFRYAAIVRKALGEIDRLKRRTYAGPELRGMVLSALGRGVKPLRAAITSLEARILEYPLSATAHVLRGELYTNLATAAADPEPALLLADSSFVEALRLLGRSETGALTPSGVMCAPALTPRQAAHKAYIDLLGLARRLVREAKLDAAKVRLDAAADAAGTAGLPTLDVTAALIDVRRGDAAAKAAAKAAVEGGRGTWYKCPQGHDYLVGECGAPMERAACPDCRGGVGGEEHHPPRGECRAERHAV